MVNNNIKGFSLVELSIVLIIIALLVSAIIGGMALVENSKIRSFMTELNSYKQAAYAFKVAKDRLPGDLNNDGIIGSLVNEKYSSSSFPEPYNTPNPPDAYSAPFIELFLEKMIDFKPTPGNNNAGFGYPKSQVFSDGDYLFYSKDMNCKSPHYLSNIKANTTFVLFTNNLTAKKSYPKRFKQVDEKLDDGLYDTGSIVTGCGTASSEFGNTDYETVLGDKKEGYCDRLFFSLGI